MEDPDSGSYAPSLVSGATIASNFDSDTYNIPNGMLTAVVERIGIDSVEAAELIRLAYNNGQLKYNSPTEYSNYIGWYADSSYDFLGFCHEEGTSPTARPANAEYIIKSYGYLGATDAEHGVEVSDLMYAVVQVRENILTGEQTVVFSIPENLLPVITYDITLDNDDNLTDLSLRHNYHNPIRLVYEVGLKDNISETTVNDPNVVSSDYISIIQHQKVGLMTIVNIQ